MRLLRYLPHFRVVSHLVPFGPTWIHNALKVLFTALSRGSSLGLGSAMRLMHYLQHFRVVPRLVPLESAMRLMHYFLHVRLVPLGSAIRLPYNV